MCVYNVCIQYTICAIQLPMTPGLRQDALFLSFLTTPLLNRLLRSLLLALGGHLLLASLALAGAETSGARSKLGKTRLRHPTWLWEDKEKDVFKSAEAVLSPL